MAAQGEFDGLNLEIDPRLVGHLSRQLTSPVGQNRKSSVGLGMSGVGGGAEVDFGRLKVRS